MLSIYLPSGWIIYGHTKALMVSLMAISKGLVKRNPLVGDL